MNNAIVILYEGQAPSESFIKEVGTAVSNTFAFGAGDVKVIHLDQNSIAKALVGKSADVIISSEIEKTKKETTVEEQIEHATTSIRETFSAELSRANNIAFILKFQQKLSLAKAREAMNPNTLSDEDAAIINATDIICQHRDIVVAKRKLTKHVVNTIISIVEDM